MHVERYQQCLLTENLRNNLIEEIRKTLEKRSDPNVIRCLNEMAHDVENTLGQVNDLIEKIDEYLLEDND